MRAIATQGMYGWKATESGGCAGRDWWKEAAAWAAVTRAMRLRTLAGWSAAAAWAAASGEPVGDRRKESMRSRLLMGC